MSTTYTPAQIGMTLAAIAYAKDGAAIDNLFADGNLATGDKQWKLVWGPASKGGNQVFAAQNSATNDFVIAIRGSLIDLSWSTVENWFDNLDVMKQVAWPYSTQDNTPMVAKGAWDGLTHIQGMQSSGVSLVQWVENVVVPAGGNLLIVGHSLGANLTTVVAPWLYKELNDNGNAGKISWTPMTFAAPTAGNTDFASNYNATFPDSTRTYNNIDLVPMCWTDEDSILELFPKPGPSIPIFTVGALVAGWWYFLEKSEKNYASTYAHTNGSGTQLTGTAVAEPKGSSKTAQFFDEVGAQHAHNNYLSLLRAPVLPSV